MKHMYTHIKRVALINDLKQFLFIFHFISIVAKNEMIIFDKEKGKHANLRIHKYRLSIKIKSTFRS